MKVIWRSRSWLLQFKMSLNMYVYTLQHVDQGLHSSFHVKDVLCKYMYVHIWPWLHNYQRSMTKLSCSTLFIISLIHHFHQIFHHYQSLIDYVLLWWKIKFSIICRSVGVSVCLCVCALEFLFTVSENWLGRMSWNSYHTYMALVSRSERIFKVHLICPCHSDFLKSVSLTIFFSVTVAPRSSWIAPKCSSHWALWR